MDHNNWALVSLAHIMGLGLIRVPFQTWIIIILRANCLFLIETFKTVYEPPKARDEIVTSFIWYSQIRKTEM